MPAVPDAAGQGPREVEGSGPEPPGAERRLDLLRSHGTRDPRLPRRAAAAGVGEAREGLLGGRKDSRVVQLTIDRDIRVRSVDHAAELARRAWTSTGTHLHCRTGACCRA